MIYWLTPSFFLKTSNLFLPVFGIASIICFSIGLYQGLYISPPDYQQGETVRIMYIHVPSAWMALMMYMLIALASISSLVWRHTLAGLIAEQAAPIGACFAAITLLTGAIWGKPTWGTWWVWDARLTSMLILFFFYLGYLLLLNSRPHAAQNTAACVLAIVGAVNVPIVKFSVTFWNTLHQPASIFRMGGPTIHPSLLSPLLWMTGAIFSLAISLLLIRVQTRLMIQKITRLETSSHTMKVR